MRQRLFPVLVAALVVLSGCSALDDITTGASEDAEFSETATFPAGGVTGESVSLTVAVENTGDAEGDHEVALSVDGEEVATESITLDEGESTTATLSHTFEEAGEYDLSVAGEDETVTIYETPRAFTNVAMAEVETQRIEETTTGDGTMVYNYRTYDFEANDTATIEKNFTAETMHTKEESEIRVQGEQTGATRDGRTEETTEVWVTDGMRYIKTVDHTEGETSHQWEPSDEFADDSVDGPGDVDALEGMDQYVRTAHTDEEYVFIVEADTSREATEFWETLAGDESAITPEMMGEFYVENRYDRQTGRLTKQVIEMTVRDFRSFEEMHITVEKDVVSYGHPVAVEVPDDIKEQATRSGAAVGSGTTASLSPAGHGLVRSAQVTP